MANELTLSGSLHYRDSTLVERALAVDSRVQSVSTKNHVAAVQSIGTSEEAINLGDVTTPALAFFRNLDPTNYIELKVATGGAIFAKLRPDTLEDGTGGFAMLELGSGAQAPFAIANTAACRLEYLIINL